MGGKLTNKTPITLSEAPAASQVLTLLNYISRVISTLPNGLMVYKNRPLPVTITGIKRKKKRASEKCKNLLEVLN
jgi:hypothetical protein